MLNIFRKIRRSLAFDENPSRKKGQIMKYSRYAIGEILLVVIGILIALQVNNWNEERKQRTKRDYYLITLLGELQENADYLSARNEIINNEIENQRSMIRRLSSPMATIDTVVKIASDELSLFYYSFSSLNNNTFTTLESTGYIEYFEPWVIEALQQLNFLQFSLKEVSVGMLSDHGLVLRDFLEVYPKNQNGNIISSSLALKVLNEIPEGQKISTLNNLLWIKGGAYYSLLRRSEPLEEKTKWLMDTLKMEYPFLKELQH
jgi:hypothetical protein